MDNGTVKKYYYAGSVRVAENSGGALYYLLTDHLGSTALTLDSAGNRLNANTELRYYPWGAMRYMAGATPTQRRFTGQALDSVAGELRFYNHETADREQLAVSGFIIHSVSDESAELPAFVNSSCPNAPPPSGCPQSSQSHRH